MTHIEPWDRPNYCNAGFGPKSIVVQQVLGERNVQKAIDVHVVVPRHKPAIAQIVDVFVKRLCITSVDIIPNKVVVRGEFEVKALYVACQPRQPVHAVQVWPVRFTAHADIRGARRGMDAEANVMVEFVDYDCAEHTRAHWFKKQGPHYDDCDDYGHHYSDCHDDYDHGHDHCDCDHHTHHKIKTLKKHKFPKCKPHHCDHDDHCKPHKHPFHCTRRFDVSVVLGINVKVMTDREVMLQPLGYPPGGLPPKPKG